LGFPRFAQPEIWKEGNPPCNRSGPLAPGIFNTSSPRFESISKASAPSRCRVKTDIAVENRPWIDDIRSADTGQLNASRRVAQLASVERIAAGVSQQRRIDDVRGRNAVTPEH